MTPAIVVVGSINVDLTVYVDRLPGPGETVTGGRFAQSHGGKGGNQAVAAARLGTKTIMIGMVGADDFGRAARAELEREGVDVEHVVQGNSHTGLAEILVDTGGENLIAVASGTNSEVDATVVERGMATIDADDAVVVAVLELPDPAVVAAARAAATRGWRFVLNPAPARHVDPGLISLCHVLTPNEHEAQSLGFASAEDLLDAGAGAVVITRGANGADLIRPGSPIHHRDAFFVRPVDTTGAGDAFSAALAVALAEGASLEDAAAMAAAAAALSTMKEGARGGLPTRSELDDFLARTAEA